MNRTSSHLKMISVVPGPSVRIGAAGLAQSSLRHSRLLLSVVLAAVLMPCASALTAGEAPTPSADIEEKHDLAFQAAVSRAAAAVVRIETVGGLERVNDVLFGTGPTTGLIVDPKGYIVSSAFNFSNKPTSILVRMPDGSRKPAQLVATDFNRMIVLLKIEVDQPLPVAETVAENEIRVGQWAIAVGRTFDSDKPNLSVGVVSARERIWGKAIQTDAKVSPNNYGGPLLDIRGRVMGVLAPLSPQAASEVAGVEWYDSGIGFAVPIESILRALPRLMKGEDLKPGLAGINLGNNLHTGDAVLGPVQANSPAAEAGLKAGDKVVEIDGRPVARAADVKMAISRRYAGDKISLVVDRKGERISASLVLVDKLEPFQHAFLGLLPMRDGSRNGAPVRFVFPNSPAAKAGLRAGDIVLGVGGKPVKGADELREEIGALKLGTKVELQIRREGRDLNMAAELAALPDPLPTEDFPAARKPRSVSGERPAVGRIALRVPEVAGETAAYVPESYDPDISYGVVVWIHGAGGIDEQPLFDRWQSVCDRYDLIFIAPKSADPQRWTPLDLNLVGKLCEQLAETYNISSTRFAVCGYHEGSGMAWTAAQRLSDRVRAAILIEGLPMGPAPEVDPLHRFAALVVSSGKAGQNRPLEQAVSALRARKIPVTTWSLGEQSRALTDDDCRVLARWIDSLDRI